MNIQPRLIEDEAKSEFGQLEARCRRCVRSAEKLWNSICESQPRVRKAARGRGRNSLFNELVADFAREEFADDADVELCEQFGTVRLHYRGKYDLGFKKVDAKGRSSNFVTPRRQRYDAQLRIFNDPLPEAIRLHIGIKWNNAATEVIDVQLVYPYRRTALWHYSLRDGGPATTGDVMKMPQPESPVSPAKFRSKTAKERDGEQKKAQ